MKASVLKQHFYFIGIGGIGMSALALILAQKGAKVSGSDAAFFSTISSLEQAGVHVVIGHSQAHIPHGAIVVYGSAVTKDNPEYEHAIASQMTLMHRSDLLELLMRDTDGLLVAGTHGKTTTSSLVAHVLKSAGLDPSFAIGGMVPSLGGNGGFGKGVYFVAEADESDGSFLKYSSFGAIITNIDTDHLDFWTDEDSLSRGFKDFADKVSSHRHLLWCADDARLLALKLKGISYGFSEGAQLHVESYHQSGWKSSFEITFDGNLFHEVEIPLVGAHNVLNAAAAFGLCLRLGIAEKEIRTAFKTFQGVARRADKKGERGGVSIYDDYAHHPTEVFATLRAIKTAVGNRRLVVAFQPHRYSRTKICLDQFPAAFEPADELIVTDIYAGYGEVPLHDVTTQILIKKIRARGSLSVQYIPRDTLRVHLQKLLKPNDVLVTMGAGDITKVGAELINQP